MKLTVKYFASIREAIGQGSEAIETRAVTLAALRDELAGRGGGYSTLARGKPIRAALNQVMSADSTLLVEGCEVGFFPPVTGG